jgi:hypothetical protein
MGAGLRPRAKVLDEPPDPTVGAPVLDPTCEGVGVRFPHATRLLLLHFLPLCYEFTAIYSSFAPLKYGGLIKSIDDNVEISAKREGLIIKVGQGTKNYFQESREVLPEAL